MPAQFIGNAQAQGVSRLGGVDRLVTGSPLVCYQVQDGREVVLDLFPGKVLVELVQRAGATFLH